MDGDVYYVDLSRVTMAELNAEMIKLANAAGVVFDVRRWPNSTHEILSHLLTPPDDSTKPDGSRFHFVGIRPTIPALRTIAGVVAGRDEILERALAYVRGPAK